MNKIKIPKNWVFKYFEVDGNITKFVYEDQLGIEHIYIDEKPEPELPTYEELENRVDFLIDSNDKKQEVLDKIKEVINHYAVEDEDYSKIYNQEEQEIMKLLEEIE